MQRNIARTCAVVLGALTILVSAAGRLYAGGPAAPAPEIDATSILSGLGLLGAGVMILRARRRSK